MMRIKIAFLLFVLQEKPTFGLDTNLLIDYFTDIKKVSHIVLFSCENDIPGDLKLVKEFHQRNIYTNLIDKSSKQSIVNILDHKILARCGVALDCDCAENRNRLLEASKNRYFNSSYSWLLISSDIDTQLNQMISLLEPLRNISINSDMTFAQKTNSSKYKVFEIFSRGQHLGQPIIRNLIGIYSVENGFSLHRGTEVRTNFTGVTLRGVTVIDRPYDIDPSTLDDLLAARNFSLGISNMSKYYYALNKILRDLYGFNVRYRVVRAWTGRVRPGYRSGLVGVVARNEVDITGCGAYTKVSRHDEVDNLHQSYKFVARFIYRITPSSTTYRGAYNSFLLEPFSKWTWMAILSTVLIFLITFLIMERFDTVITDSWLNTIATISQQGIDFVSGKYQTKILIISLKLISLLLFNCYTSYMVRKLLTDLPQGPTTIKELLESPLTVSFEDLGYHRALFAIDRTMLPWLIEINEYKLKHGRKLKALPPFTTIQKALPYIRSGECAYHSEINLMYPFIARNFTPAEICELRTIYGVWGEYTMTMMLSSKQNQYSEMFKIGLNRARELGLLKRASQIYVDVEIPKCNQNAKIVYPISLYNIKYAFFVLFGGYILCFGILIIEKVYYRITRHH